MTSLSEYGRVESLCLILLPGFLQSLTVLAMCFKISGALGRGKEFDYSSHVQRHIPIFVAREHGSYRFYETSVSLDPSHLTWL